MNHHERIIPVREGPHNPIVVVTGVSAAGKNHLLRRALPRWNIFRPRIRSVEVGDEIMHTLRRFTNESQNLPTTRDEIRTSVDTDTLKKYTAWMLSKKVYDLVVSGDALLLNSHVVFKQGDQLDHIDGIYQLINPLWYVIVLASAEAVQERRKKNSKKRKRPSETIDQINLHQSVLLEKTVHIAEQTGSGVVVLVNRKDNVRSNARIIRRVISNTRAHKREREDPNDPSI